MTKKCKWCGGELKYTTLPSDELENNFATCKECGAIIADENDTPWFIENKWIQKIISIILLIIMLIAVFMSLPVAEK